MLNLETDVKQMLDAGAHFGHQTYKWNPKMEQYIYGPFNNIHIIDLRKTYDLLEKALKFISELTEGGNKLLFVGTKKQIREIVASSAHKADQYYVNNRWLGGMLTNFKTIKKSVNKMKSLNTKSQDGTYENLPKKEIASLTRKYLKLEKNLIGIKDMDNLPKAIFVIDPSKETIAISEAKKLGIKIIALIDTNCNPDLIDFPIPGNDDSVKSVEYFLNKIVEECIIGSNKYKNNKKIKRN